MKYFINKDKKHINIRHMLLPVALMFATVLVIFNAFQLASPAKIYAAENAKVYMWIEVKWEDGSPLPGQSGDLFGQLLLTVKYKGNTIYNGPMDGLAKPKEVTGLMGDLSPGKTYQLDLTVYLPGPETGNEFQGSTMSTSFLVHTQCITSDGKDVILKPILEPNNMLFNLSNLNPGDRYDKSLIIKIPELPETAISEKIVEVLGLKPFLEVLAFTGIHPAIIISSIALILMGSILISLSIRRKKRALPKQP